MAQYTVIARAKDYWMSPQALTITLNVRDEANRISASVAGGARFFCHFEDIGDPDAEDMFGYDVGHNFPSWPLAISPTYFNTNEAIYLHIAIPREDRGDSQAMVVFPSEVLDLWGYACNAVPMQDEEGNYIDEHGNIVARAEDAATAYVRKKQAGTETDADPIGSQDYYYIYLQGRLTASGAAGTTPREWDPMYATGLLNTDETWGEVITIDQLAKEMKKKVDVEWFMRIFTIHGTDRKRRKADGSDEWETDEDGNIIYTGDGEAMVIRPNDMTHEITDTESMFGTWTEQFISALSKGSGSGGGGGGGGGDALEWPLQDINVAGMPKVNETGGPEAGDTIVWDGQTFVWGAGLDTTKLAAWLVANDYKKQTELDLRYLKLVAPSQTITGNLNIQGDLTIARTPISDFEHLADGIVLTFGEAKAFFDTRYITVTFWNRLFSTYSGTTQVQANGAGLIDNLKILVGTWTEEFISALGTGSAGGGGGGVAYLSQLEDVSLSSPANGQILQFNGSQWVNAVLPSGTDMATVWNALASSDSSHQIDYSHLSGAISINNGTITIGSQSIPVLGNFLPLAGGVMGGKITFNQGSSARDVGIIGTYDPNRAAAIWAMGSSYQITADGLTMGNLYGACYAYYGTGYTYGAGKSGGHSFVWCQNGNPTVALGDNVWTSGGFIKNGSSDSYVLLGGGGHAAISALSVNYANSANFANYVYCSSHIGSWRLSSDWDGSYFWLTAKYDSSSLPCATAYATSAGTASSADYATNAGYASSAGRLSDNTSYTAWGQSFWSYGTPNSISGNMSGVGDIQCTAGSRIHGNGGALYIGNANNASWVQIADMCSQSGSSYWNIYANGSASFQSVYSTGAVSSLSDIRYKDIVRHFALNIEAIANASIIQFRWKESHDTDTHVGGIAQEWQAILPDAVHETKDGKLAMDYGTIAYTSAVSLARKVVEQQREIDDLKERLAKLERLLERRDAETQEHKNKL